MASDVFSDFIVILYKSLYRYLLMCLITQWFHEHISYQKCTGEIIPLKLVVVVLFRATFLAQYMTNEGQKALAQHEMLFVIGHLVS